MQPTSPNDDPAAALLEQAINALKAGDSARARDLLAQAIQQNPTDDRAWLWLSGAVTTDADRRRCLERALALNPRNQAARRGLALLRRHRPRRRHRELNRRPLTSRACGQFPASGAFRRARSR